MAANRPAGACPLGCYNKCRLKCRRGQPSCPTRPHSSCVQAAHAHTLPQPRAARCTVRLLPPPRCAWRPWHKQTVRSRALQAGMSGMVRRRCRRISMSHLPQRPRLTKQQGSRGRGSEPVCRDPTATPTALPRQAARCMQCARRVVAANGVQPPGTQPPLLRRSGIQPSPRLGRSPPIARQSCQRHLMQRRRGVRPAIRSLPAATARPLCPQRRDPGVLRA